MMGGGVFEQVAVLADFFKRRFKDDLFSCFCRRLFLFSSLIHSSSSKAPVFPPFPQTKQPPKMVLVVLPALIPDIPRIYEIYFQAFDNDDMGRLMTEILFPSGVDTEFKKAHAAATLAYWHTSSSQFTFKCIDTETGEIVGMCLADVVVKPEENRVNPGVEWLEGEQRARAERILTPLWEAREELLGNQPHICK